ncbi:MAG: serine/threonine protein kinase, partial [Cystobacterineae bacterium]|nr:serine/threonine protein kinase [Cystobacterineae bacterium]
MEKKYTPSCPICHNIHTAHEPCASLAKKTNPPAHQPILDKTASIIGQPFGSFRAVRLIGEGGMGSVYLGKHTLIGSKVAIKILHEHLAANPQLVQRFYAEARAVNLIGHANIVNIFDMNLIPPRLYYLIMEYLEGCPLNDLLTSPMECSIALGILEQVCDALDAAHACGVIHRDLKPENIFIAKVGRNERFVKILDFGIAKLFSENTAQKTATGIIVGTPEYMAPEQTLGLPVDAQTDIYSLGIVAYAMATARLPFGGGTTDLLLAHRERLPIPPQKLNPALPKAWSDAILKALHKNPADRYATAAAFAQALSRAIKPSSLSPPPAP